MRGLAAILAASSGWIVVAGLGSVSIRRPKFNLRTLGIAAAVFVLTSAVSFGLLGVAIAAGAIGVIAASVPFAVSSSRALAKEAEHRDRWPDILLQIRSSVSAGSTLGDAVIMSFSGAGGRFEVMAERIRREVMFGGGFQAALAQVRKDEGDATSDRVFVALAAASRTGGVRVGEVIGLLARSVGDEIRLRKAHDAALTEQRLTINVALAAPWVLLALSIATNPQASDAFNTPTGGLVIALGLAATVGGWALAMRTARLRRPNRVFR